MKLCRQGLHDLDNPTVAYIYLSDGKRRCRPCQQSRAGKWRTAHPERMRTHRRTWRAAHPELERDSSRAWKVANPERIRRSAQKRYAANPAHYIAFSRTWQSTHPERRRATEQRRRARIAGVLTTLTADEWEAILESAGHVCIYCGSQDSLTMDHVVPISKGGQHVAENIVPACLSCNSSKGPQLISEFLSEENTSRKVAF